MPDCMYVEEISSAAKLAIKMFAGVTPEVNLGEHVICMPLPSANKALALNPRGDITKSPKQGISCPQKDLCLSKCKKMFIR